MPVNAESVLSQVCTAMSAVGVAHVEDQKTIAITLPMDSHPPLALGVQELDPKLYRL